MFLVAGGFGVWLAGPLEFLINFMVMSLPYSYGWLSLLLSGACLVISLHVGCPSFCVMVEWALEKCRGPKLLLQLFVRSFRTVSIHLRLFQFVSPTDAVRGLYLISNIMRASGFLILFGVWASNFFCFFPSLGGNKLLVFWVVSRGVGYQDEGMCLVFLYCSCFEKEFCASCFG